MCGTEITHSNTLHHTARRLSHRTSSLLMRTHMYCLHICMYKHGKTQEQLRLSHRTSSPLMRTYTYCLQICMYKHVKYVCTNTSLSQEIITVDYSWVFPMWRLKQFLCVVFLYLFSGTGKSSLWNALSMCKYMCLSICTYMYMRIYINVYIFIHVQAQVNRHFWMLFLCVYICIYLYVHIYICVYI